MCHLLLSRNCTTPMGLLRPFACIQATEIQLYRPNSPPNNVFLLDILLDYARGRAESEGDGVYGKKSDVGGIYEHVYPSIEALNILVKLVEISRHQ